MRVVIVYKPQSDHAREVTDYIRDLKQQTGKEVDEIDPEARVNQGFIQAYDVVEYPTILALSDDGQVLNTWRGTPLPRISEVSFYAG